MTPIFPKFVMSNDTSEINRQEVEPTGRSVIFRVSGYDLSIMANEGSFPDFTALSDYILENRSEPEGDGLVYYQWVGSDFHLM